MSNAGEGVTSGYERWNGGSTADSPDPLFSKDVTSPLYGVDAGTMPTPVLGTSMWVRAVPTDDHEASPSTATTDTDASADETGSEPDEYAEELEPELNIASPVTLVRKYDPSTNTAMVQDAVDIHYYGKKPTVLDGTLVRARRFGRKKPEADEFVKEDVQHLDKNARSRVLGRTAAAAVTNYVRSWHSAAMKFAHEWDFPLEAPTYDPADETGNTQKNLDSIKYNVQKGTRNMLPIIRLGGSTALVAAGLVIASKENWTYNGTMQLVDTFAVALMGLFVYAINKRRTHKTVTVAETPRRERTEKHAVVSHAKQFGLDTANAVKNFTRANDKELQPPMQKEKGKTKVRERTRYAKAVVAQQARRATRGVGLGLLAAATAYAWFKESVEVGNTQPFDNFMTFLSTITGLSVAEYWPVHSSKKDKKAEADTSDKDTATTTDETQSEQSASSAAVETPPLVAAEDNETVTTEAVSARASFGF